MPVLYFLSQALGNGDPAQIADEEDCAESESEATSGSPIKKYSEGKFVPDLIK